MVIFNSNKLINKKEKGLKYIIRIKPNNIDIVLPIKIVDNILLNLYNRKEIEKEYFI